MDLDYAALGLIEDLKNTLNSVRDYSALAFSGGIDSTLLMHLSDYRLKAYTVSTGSTKDIQNAVYVSGLLGFDFKPVEVSKGDVLDAYRFLMKLDPSISVQEAGYESVFYLTMKSIDENTLLTGQGSDELFYGYRKYIEQEVSNSGDLKKLFEITAPREKLISKALGKKAVMPYLSPGIREIASSMTKDQCIVNGVNKVVVRRAAELSGIPKEVYLMPKKAAQYGSGVQKILNSISRGD